jgi:thiamine-phosphate pyrophosphorylase
MEARPKRLGALGLYLITSPSAPELLALVEDAVRGGVTMVQLRDKEASDAKLYEQGRKLMELLAPLGIPLLINDRVLVAKSLGAGLHIGMDDADPATARSVLGPEAWLGVTIHKDVALARRYREVADYVGVGPVFPTQTKSDAKSTVGTTLLGEIVAGSPLPVVAVGGIGEGNVSLVRASGAAGVAVCSAICSSSAPVEAAKRLAAQSVSGVQVGSGSLSSHSSSWEQVFKV